MLSTHNSGRTTFHTNAMRGRKDPIIYKIGRIRDRCELQNLLDKLDDQGHRKQFKLFVKKSFQST